MSKLSTFYVLYYHLQTFSSLLGVAGFGEPVTFLAVLCHMSVLQ